MRYPELSQTQKSKKDVVLQQIQLAKKHIESMDSLHKNLEDSMQELTDEIERNRQRKAFHQMELEIAEESYKAILLNEEK